MKNSLFKFAAFFVITLLFLCCQSENVNDVDNADYNDTAIVASSLLKSDGTFSIGNFTISEQQVKNFQTSLLHDLKYSKVFIGDVKVIETTLLKTKKGRFLLRTRFDNNKTTTSVLDIDKMRKARLGVGGVNLIAAVSCTSTSCASGGGCIPDFWGLYCQECTKGTKDCTRTTSN